MTEQSILNSVKKLLGISQDYDVFDTDIILHTNSVFSTLHQLGVGPVIPFEVNGSAETWSQFIQDRTALNSVKSYVYLKVRLMFDPPSTSFAIQAMEKQATEIEWRLNIAHDHSVTEGL